MDSTYGDATIEMVGTLVDAGIDHIALLMRHSAREFNPDVHDLVNPLTDEGRALSRRLGEALPKSYTLRAYASPPERCMETAQLALEAHTERGGAATRVRPVEGLGVFYVLDQMKMFRRMREADGLGAFVTRWSAGEMPLDTMIPADQAARLALRVVADKLEQPVAARQIDMCVSHDLTLMLVQDQLLDQSASEHDVEFLDAVAVFRRNGVLHVQSRHGPARGMTALV